MWEENTAYGEEAQHDNTPLTTDAIFAFKRDINGLPAQACFGTRRESFVSRGDDLEM